MYGILYTEYTHCHDRKRLKFVTKLSIFKNKYLLIMICLWHTEDVLLTLTPPSGQFQFLLGKVGQNN